MYHLLLMFIDNVVPPINLIGNRELNMFLVKININNWTSVTTPVDLIHFLHS